MTRLGWREVLLAWLLFTGLAFFVYEPALHGPLLSDDYIYFVGRPYMESLTPANVLTILDPLGDPVVLTWNWAPVHLLAHSVLRALLGNFENTYRHHLVNLGLHGLNATLLLALFVRCRVPLAAAAAGALLFFLHPANVESVAWIFQLKTLLSFACGIGALLCLVRRPAWATVLFALGLLVKPSAAAMLAAGIVFEWLRAPGPNDPPRRTRWLVLWAALFAAYALPELSAFRNTAEFRQPLPAGERVLSAVAILGRYAVLVLSSVGTSTFQQPDPPASPFDAWFALGLVTLLALGAVSVLALVRKHPAAPWLALAAASYAPVSQVLAFRYPMADRYVYFVLAGLLGAALVALAPWLRAAWANARRSGVRAAGGLVALGAAALVLAVGFGVRAHERAAVFGSAERFERDAVLHYPDGLSGQLARARVALARGDTAGALDALEAAHGKGYRNALLMMRDPAFAQLHGDPRFTALAQQLAREWIAQYETLPRRIPDAEVDLFQNQLLLGEREAALDTLARLERMPERIDPRVVHQLRRQAEQQAEHPPQGP